MKEFARLKNIQLQGFAAEEGRQSIDLVLISRLDHLSLEGCQGQSCMGRNDFCLGMNLDEFGQVLKRGNGCLRRR